jgi:hypothetical protein
MMMTAPFSEGMNQPAKFHAIRVGDGDIFKFKTVIGGSFIGQVTVCHWSMKQIVRFAASPCEQTNRGGNKNCGNYA